MGGRFSVNVVENDHRLNFFGLSLPWLPVVLLYQLPLLFFLLLAATRKMESAAAPSALQAAGHRGHADVRDPGARRDLAAGQSTRSTRSPALYLLVVPALLLTMMVTPDAGRIRQGPLSRPEAGQDAAALVGRPLGELGRPGHPGGDRAGGRRPSPGTVAAGHVPARIASQTPGPYPLALAAAVLTVAYFGLAFQYFQLRFAKRGMMYFALFLFIVWLLPLSPARSSRWRPGRGVRGRSAIRSSP